jgi:protein TonB
MINAMARGKQTCKVLKEIRRQIAEANDIEFITSECQYLGDCPGTCPKCEAEVRSLEQQLLNRQRSGLSVKIVGISLGLSAALISSPLYGQEAIKDSLSNSCDSLPKVEVTGGKTEKTHQVAGTTITAEELKALSLKKEEAMFGIVEAMPEFPGGQKALMTYIAKNTNYPQDAPCISGRVIVQFTITKKGKIIDAKVARGIHPVYDKEALRIIKKMPTWKPGTQMGKPVAVRYTVPIVFRAKQ